jgi:hypothetical protein
MLSFSRPTKVLTRCALVAACLLLPSAVAEPVPAALTGAWRISRIVPTSNQGCWTPQHAQAFVGTTLFYTAHSIRWQGQEVHVPEVVLRPVTDADFRAETGGDSAATFAELGITAKTVMEADLQHEDMDITGGSTEVPGDAALLVAPGRIIISACGVYMEAVKSAPAARVKKR